MLRLRCARNRLVGMLAQQDIREATPPDATPPEVSGSFFLCFLGNKSLEGPERTRNLIFGGFFDCLDHEQGLSTGTRFPFCKFTTSSYENRSESNLAETGRLKKRNHKVFLLHVCSIASMYLPCAKKKLAPPRDTLPPPIPRSAEHAEVNDPEKSVNRRTLRRKRIFQEIPWGKNCAKDPKSYQQVGRCVTVL